jgi:hypothetical protein
MKELYIEGVATHDDPESCAGARKGAGEALTGACAGRAMEPRKTPVWGADVVAKTEGDTAGSAMASCWTAPRGRRT